jgi:SHS family lactate transporter-like MFS transporter
MLLWTAAFIPLWILPNTFGGLTAGAFFLQFGVQGAWGVIVSVQSINVPTITSLIHIHGYARSNSRSTSPNPRPQPSVRPLAESPTS